MGTDEISKDLASQIQMDNSIWYVCKYCRRAYQNQQKLLEHKRSKHSNERKLAKKKQEEEKSGNGNEDSGIEKVVPCETVTCSATSPSEDQNQNNINMLGIGVPIPVSVQLNLDPDIADDKKSVTELLGESESLCNLHNQDFSSHDDAELNLIHSEIENNNVGVGMEENSAVPLIRVEVADDAGADDDMDINLKLGNYNLDLTNALSSPSAGLKLSEGHCQPLSQSYDLVASAVATLTNAGTSHRDRGDESDSEIECVFDSHRPLGSPMKPLSPTPGPVPAAAASVRTWNIKDFKGAFAKFLPPVPILTASGFEYENGNPKTCPSTTTTTTTSGPGSSSNSIKRKFLSLSSSPDYQDLDSTKEIVAKLEVLGQHQYCLRCFKMFLRPSSHKAHRKICHLKTVSSFQEFKSKFQIEIRSLQCHHHQQTPTQSKEQQSHVPNSKSDTANYSAQLCICGKKKDIVDHVLVKIPDCDQMKAEQESQSSSISDELPSENKIRKIQTRQQQQGENNLDNNIGNSLNQNQSEQMPSETQQQQIYKCKLCGCSFEYKTELTSHLLVHMSASPDRRSDAEKSRNTTVGQSQNRNPSGTISTSKQVIEISDGHRDSKSENNKNNKQPQEPTSRRPTPLRYRICNRYRYSNRNNRKTSTLALASSPSSVIKSNKKSDGSSTFSLKKHLTKESKPNIFYRFHTRGKPFSCPICPSASKSKSEFCLHMKSHRRNGAGTGTAPGNSKIKILNSLNRSYQEESSICKMCLKSFYKFEDLLQHLRNHRFSPVPIIMEDQY